MNFTVHFLGLILFVTVIGGNGTNYHVVMPDEGTDPICGKTPAELGDHQVFVRVDDPNQVVRGETNWPDEIPCLTGGCVLFPVNDAHLDVLNVSTTGPVQGSPVTAYHLRSMHPSGANATLQSGIDAKPLSSADMDITTGALNGSVENNHMRSTKWVLQTETGKNIVITATPRGGGTPLRLSLKPGTTVKIINAVKNHARKDIGNLTGTDDQDHFVIYYRLTKPVPQNPADCKVPSPDRTPSPAPNEPILSLLQVMQRRQEIFKMNQEVGSEVHPLSGHGNGAGGVSISCSNSQWP